ncbi:MAG: hypothetical protein WA117_01930 [Verrucomicrobiia bacterium]
MKPDPQDFEFAVILNHFRNHPPEFVLTRMGCPPNNTPSSFTALARLGVISYANVTNSPRVNRPPAPCAGFFIIVSSPLLICFDHSLS